MPVVLVVPAHVIAGQSSPVQLTRITGRDISGYLRISQDIKINNNSHLLGRRETWWSEVIVGGTTIGTIRVKTR